MGLPATACRYMFLTARKDDISLQLNLLADTKTRLMGDMDEVSREYQNALNQKNYKWTNNGGATYTDIRYCELMKPSSMNQNKPYLITDQNEKIVVDKQYQKYAELISPNGNPGGDWRSSRTEILSELTGIDQAKIEAAISNNGEDLTSNEKTLIKFYDTLFSSIAEKGWTYNEQVSDPDYLNQVFQNNFYTITTVDSTSEYDIFENGYTWKNEYNTDVVSNMKNIVTVNDKNSTEIAYAEYQNKKSKINMKETRIDMRMKNLETEQSAINQMLESYQKIMQDNIDRTLNLFS